jgi:hypothetical protein
MCEVDASISIQARRATQRDETKATRRTIFGLGAVVGARNILELAMALKIVIPEFEAAVKEQVVLELGAAVVCPYRGLVSGILFVETS